MSSHDPRRSLMRDTPLCLTGWTGHRTTGGHNNSNTLGGLRGFENTTHEGPEDRAEAQTLCFPLSQVTSVSEPSPFMVTWQPTVVDSNSPWEMSLIAMSIPATGAAVDP